VSSPRGADAKAGGDRGRAEERYERVIVEDKGNVFKHDLTQALELGFLLELAACMVPCGIERKESRGAHARPATTIPTADDEHYLRHTLVRWVDGGPIVRLEARDHDQVATPGKDVTKLHSELAPAPGSYDD